MLQSLKIVFLKSCAVSEDYEAPVFEFVAKVKQLWEKKRFAPCQKETEHSQFTSFRNKGCPAFPIQLRLSLCFAFWGFVACDSCSGSKAS
jgi:hypothetical protein